MSGANPNLVAILQFLAFVVIVFAPLKITASNFDETELISGGSTLGLLALWKLASKITHDKVPPPSIGD